MEILKQNLQTYKKAKKFLDDGEVIAYATDTVYGLGCDPMSAAAVEKIYEIKQREADKKLIVLIDKNYDIKNLVENISEDAQLLISNFWPGPLTLIFKARKDIHFHDYIAGNEGKIALRMPSEKNISKMLETVGLITSTSANISGKQILTSAQEIKETFPTLLLIIEGKGGGMPSTVIDVSGIKPLVKREGAITKEMIYEKLGEIL